MWPFLEAVAYWADSKYSRAVPASEFIAQYCQGDFASHVNATNGFHKAVKHGDLQACPWLQKNGVNSASKEVGLSAFRQAGLPVRA